jgi:hypothetical protein
LNKKKLHTLVVLFQWVASLILAIYLITPVYRSQVNTFRGDSMYSPYENWQQIPLQIIQLKGDHFTGTKPDSILQILPFLPRENIYLLDTVDQAYYSPFLLGHSKNQLQYLLKKSGFYPRFLYKNDLEADELHLGLIGVSLHVLTKEDEISSLDLFLERGIPSAVIAGESDEIHSYNLLMAASGDAEESMSALLNGNNLLVFSENEIYYDTIPSIPVIRKIEWEENTLRLDLSQKGQISIISAGFHLDTLAHNLTLKLNDPRWFRFEVKFPDEKISYISNPYFKYANQAFDVRYPKANNQLTIFINLSWLLGIILLNLAINKWRNKYL